MVFTPSSGGPFQPPSADEVLDAQLTAKARRGRSILHPTPTTERRLAWRAVVRARQREAIMTEWHLVGCSDPTLGDAHCPEGRRLIETIGQPEGHCLVKDRCPVCDLAD